MSPTRPPSSCIIPGCGGLAYDGARCDEHKRPAWEKSPSSTSTRTGSTRAWRKRREAVLRAVPWCTADDCHALAVEVHHVNGDPTDDRWENLTGLCELHHREMTAEQARQARRKRG